MIAGEPVPFSDADLEDWRQWLRFPAMDEATRNWGRMVVRFLKTIEDRDAEIEMWTTQR